MNKKIILPLILFILIVMILLIKLIPFNIYIPDSPYGNSEWINEYKYSKDEILDLKFDTKRGRTFFDIAINNVETEAYFDSGSAFGICVSGRLVRNGDFKTKDYIEVYNSEGDLISSSPQFDVNEFYIGNIQKQLSTGIILGGKYSFFGFEPLKDGRITIDYKNEKAAISHSKIPYELTCKENTEIFKFKTVEGSGNGFIIIPVTINDVEYYAMVDTGASVTVVDEEIYKQLNVNKNIFGRIPLNNLTIGRYKISLPSVAVHSQRAVGRGLDKKIMVTIGADVLCQYLVTIDYNKGYLILEGSKQ